MKKIFTDGACKGNPGRGGWGFAVYDEQEVEIASKFGSESLTTNNRMELQAVLEALLFYTNDEEEIMIITDSNYVYRGITSWITRWKKNGWKTCNGTEIRNQDLWLRLDLQSRKNTNFEWIKAHNGNRGNERADELANQALKN